MIYFSFTYHELGHFLTEEFLGVIGVDILKTGRAIVDYGAL